MWKPIFAGLLALHGAIHLLGFVKGFALAPVEQLKEPITRAQGALWLAAAALFLAAAIAWVLGPRGAWWIPAVPAVLLSQALIIGAWSDARFGTVANVLVLVPLVIGLADLRPSSLRSLYRRAVADERAAALAAPARGVIEARELDALPPPVQRWLKKAGVIGRPRVRGFEATMRGAMRNGQDAPWMTSTFTQQNTVSPGSRLFLLEASMKGVPFVAYHAYRGAHATMQVRVLGLAQIIDARGPEMDKSETVTLLNDLVVLAPAATLDAPITWQPIDDHSARATLSNAGHTVSAVLTFKDDDLVGFVSQDRLQSADGKAFKALPWSTPLRDHQVVDGVRLPRGASAIWLDPAGDLEYARFSIETVRTF